MLTIRKDLEVCVCAYNKYLREAVKEMSPVILLRNCHPIYRKDYARRLFNEGLITEDEWKEFKTEK
jgi:uncharacterized protein YqkB